MVANKIKSVSTAKVSKILTSRAQVTKPTSIASGSVVSKKAAVLAIPSPRSGKVATSQQAIPKKKPTASKTPAATRSIRTSANANQGLKKDGTQLSQRNKKEKSVQPDLTQETDSGKPKKSPTKPIPTDKATRPTLAVANKPKSVLSPMPVTKNLSASRSNAPTPAPTKLTHTNLENTKARNARVKGVDTTPAPTVLTSNAAKASYHNYQPAPTQMHPTPSLARKDPKLKDNWKVKAPEQLTDAEIVSMPDSEYMKTAQLQFFRYKLLQLKREILDSANETTEHLRDDSSVVPDPTDRATIEEEHALELRTRDRERKLLKKIEQSIARIDAGDYGYCDETGEPIGTGRLLARPTATLSLEAQQRRELKQKLFGD